jgi:hypothetical protein
MAKGTKYFGCVIGQDAQYMYVWTHGIENNYNEIKYRRNQVSHFKLGDFVTFELTKDREEVQDPICCRVHQFTPYTAMPKKDSVRIRVRLSFAPVSYYAHIAHSNLFGIAYNNDFGDIALFTDKFRYEEGKVYEMAITRLAKLNRRQRQEFLSVYRPTSATMHKVLALDGVALCPKIPPP